MRSDIHLLNTSEVAVVLGVWFPENADGPDLDHFRSDWFDPDPALDDHVREHLAMLHYRLAAHAALDLIEVPQTAQETLAALILLDQVPRNLFRDQAMAFDCDEAAHGLADAALDVGHDLQVPPVARLFFYLPFQHREDADAQARSCVLIEALPDDCSAKGEAVASARAHQAVIQRFGRFPTRNAALGRRSTPEELAYLAQGDPWG